MAIPSTVDRVPCNTAEHVNQMIQHQIEERITYYAQHPEQIDQRLMELDREWDTERLLETQASSLMLLGTILGMTVSKKFLIIPAVVAGFLLQHGIQGWCPPVPVIRRLGFRTQSEIDQEKYALKALRGDFGPVDTGDEPADATHKASRVLEAARC